MLLSGKRGLGVLLAGVLFFSLPAGVLAEDTEQSLQVKEQEEIQIKNSPEETNHNIQDQPKEDSVVDLEKQGYFLKLTEGEAYEYTGEKIEPEFEIMYREDGEEKKADLKKDTDYKAEYADNVEISADSEKKPSLIIEGISDEGKGYKGTLKVSFEIIEPKSGAVSMEAEQTVMKNDGQEPAVSVNDCVITLGTRTYICDGTAKTPAVTVKHGNTVLTCGTDYTVSYENNTNAGTASVIITGINAYKDIKRAEFSICLGSTALNSATSYSKITLKWNRVPGAGGYEVQRSTRASSGFKPVKKITSGQTLSYADSSTKFNSTYYYKIRPYCTVNSQTVYGEWSSVKKQTKQVAAPRITRVKEVSGRMRIAWKKVSGASGYALYRSTSENGKYKKIATLTKSSKVSYTDKKISKGKVYYYKVRAYRKVKSKKYYGQLSAAVCNTVPKRTVVKDTGSNTGSGWRYVNGYKLYYDTNGRLVKDVSGIIGRQSSYVIKVNKKKNCVTVYAKDGKNGYIIPVKAFPCSAGKATPITTAKTPAKYRWHRLNGNCYGQWCTRIKQGYLFHSVMYGKTKNTSLSVSNYNKLGTTASHGCIRLRAGDAKWIYDNCKLKTKVIIYNSSNPGPLGKPSAVKLPKWHKWDPTDPTARAKCRQKGCH